MSLDFYVDRYILKAYGNNEFILSLYYFCIISKTIILDSLPDNLYRYRAASQEVATITSKCLVTMISNGSSAKKQPCFWLQTQC